jgi:hypothetical protein
MAKTVMTHKRVNGKVIVVPVFKPTKAQRRSTENLIPLTKAPSRIAQTLWH